MFSYEFISAFELEKFLFSIAEEFEKTRKMLSSRWKNELYIKK